MSQSCRGVRFCLTASLIVTVELLNVSSSVQLVKELFLLRLPIGVNTLCRVFTSEIVNLPE